MNVESDTAFSHTPVLLNEAVHALALKNGDTVVDCTVGGGGHAEKILQEISPDGRLVGIDRDAQALDAASKRLRKFEGRYHLVHDNFRRLDEILREQSLEKVDGVLMDLGVSSFHFDNAVRGFSFQARGPLDMRMDIVQKQTAKDIVNQWPEEDLAMVFRRYGEVRNARAVARAIVRERSHGSIDDTLRLAQVVGKAGGWNKKRIHPATKVFQALRMAVNDELGALREALPKAVRCLNPRGRVCVISFHSLEDRVVKQFFQGCSKKCVCPPGMPVCRCGAQPVLRLVTRKPVKPSAAEIAANPRSRSAKMRVAERINKPAKEPTDGLES